MRQMRQMRQVRNARRNSEKNKNHDNMKMKNLLEKLYRMNTISVKNVDGIHKNIINLKINSKGEMRCIDPEINELIPMKSYIQKIKMKTCSFKPINEMWITTQKGDIMKLKTYLEKMN